MKHLPLIVSFVLLALLVTCDGRAEEPPEAGPKVVAIDALQQKQLDDVLLQFGQLRQQLDREHLVLDTNTATLNEGVPLLDPDQSPGTSEGADDSS